MRIKLMIAATLAVSMLLSACNFNAGPEATHTVAATDTPIIVTPTNDAVSMANTAVPLLTPLNTPSPTMEILIASATPSPTPLPPTATHTPSPTPGPYEHTIREGEVLLSIVQQYGYFDLSIIDDVVALNDNIPNANILPGPGNVILIPRQTATPVPAGLELTATVNAQLGVQNVGSVTLAENTEIVCYEVQQGDTAVGIAEAHNTTLEILAQLNRDLNWLGCDFSNYSGGPNCNPNIVEGACINVPAPTPTPTLSPTPSGLETATPTPTYPAPPVVSPPNGAVAPPRPITLYWVSVGILKTDEVYLVEVFDTTNGQVYRQITRDTSLELPDSLVPQDGQTHAIQWQVSVARQTGNGVYGVISATPQVYSFQWQSR
ncbi:MAG: LysM domain-containing protein [Chloroflexi bacterium]|nr:MAG: LysM domain-containing protein [Chloroflexota bacterium]